MSIKPRTWTDEQFLEAVKQSDTISDVLTRLGLRPRGENYKTFHRHAERLNADTSHFLGKAHLTGKNRRNLSTRIPLVEILVENSTYMNTGRLARRLVTEGVLEEKCHSCGLTEWLGQKMPLELDHMNGVNNDHRRENLRFLCPNCHALTPTFRGKNTPGERIGPRERERRQMERLGLNSLGDLRRWRKQKNDSVAA